MLSGQLVSLLPYTKSCCHELYMKYISDSMMTHEDYVYNFESVEQYYNNKVLSKDRRYFAIVKDNTTIGEIQIKSIDFEKRYGTLSIIIANDKYKNKGYGTEAIKLILKYAKEELMLKKVYADTVHRNTRSQYVLERLGFKHIKDDELLSYYEICF